MNLIQIQEHLKDLPTQAIMAYANGKNPEVPPYMALGEMNRRKNMEQRAAQAPDSSVKEKLESELNQQIALPGIRQGMNMRINPSGMPEPVPAAQPQMAPPMPPMQNPALARSMPAQPMSQQGETPGMADGGLATLPVDPDMFNYAPGGIVAFANPDNEQVVPSAVSDEAVASGGAAPEGGQGLPVALANQIMASQLRGNLNLPMPVSREEERKKLMESNPELAPMLKKIPGEALTKLASELESQNAAQKSRFQEGEGRRGLAALSNALIAAGEATRGQKGMGLGAAFGGFGKAFNQSTMEAEDRAAKQQALERAQTIETIKLQSDIDNMQRAFAEGRLDDAMKYKAAIEARQGKIAELQGARSKDVLDLENKNQQHQAQMQRYKSQEAHEQRMYEQAKRSADLAATNKTTPEDKKLAIALARSQGDNVIKTLAKQAADATTDEEYQSILRKIEAREAAIYKNAGVKTSPTETQSTVQTAVNDKGETITSTDGGVTWKDAKGKIVK